MTKITQKEFDAIIFLNGEKRYEYFIKRVVDQEKLFGLYDDGWAMYGLNSSEKQILALWPEPMYAESCANDLWINYKCKSIDLEEFVGSWIEGMKKDKIDAGIFPLRNNMGIVISPEKLKDDLDTELEKY